MSQPYRAGATSLSHGPQAEGREPEDRLSVSVVTVAYNGMPHVTEALESLADQTYSNVEHVVVDGCSTDGTSDVLQRSEPDVYVREPDDGLYDALNKAIIKTSGDIVGLLHTDDRYADPHVIRTVVHRFMADRSLDVVLTDISYVNDEGAEIRRYRSDRFKPERLRWGWMPAHPGMFVRRELYERVGLYEIDYEIAADYEWVLRAFTQETVNYTHLPIVSVHMRTGGASTRNLRSTIVLNREVKRACRENGVETSYLRLLTKYPLKLLDKFWRR